MARHIHIDPFNGIAGDMLLSALVCLGASAADIEAAVNSALSPKFGSVRLVFTEVRDFAVKGLRLKVVPDLQSPPPSLSYPEITALIRSAALPEKTAETALRAFAEIGAAEALAHGVSLEETHFHELGGVDSVVDFIGVPLGLDLLGIKSVSCSPPPLGGGKIICAHGTLPAPAPATLEILKGMEVAPSDVDAEITTPTGAALAKSLCPRFSSPPAMTLEATSAGFGSMKFKDRPNCLRLFLGKTQCENEIRRERLFHIEANIDDMPAEILATLIDVCLDAGALDAWLSPVLMKKGRPAHILNALCPLEALSGVEKAVFRSSSTLGARITTVDRDSLARTFEEVETPWGKVSIKQGFLDGKPVAVSPEFEDCRRIAAEQGIALKDVYDHARAAAAKKFK